MTNAAITRLKEHNIKPSAQRISIMEYLMSHRTYLQRFGQINADSFENDDLQHAETS